MHPKPVDWKMFLGTEFGLAPEQPFNRAKYAQWRCYWDFGGGMYTDLFVHQLTHLIQAMGVRFPTRVVGAGGLYLEYDGRDVPDVATVVADYDEGCQVVISATMGNDVQLGEVIRGMLPLSAEVKRQFTYRIGEQGRKVLYEGAAKGSSRRSRLTAEEQNREYAVLNYLESGETAKAGALRSATGAGRGLLEGMVKKKWLVREF